MTFQEDLKKKYPDRIYPVMKNLWRVKGEGLSYRRFLRASFPDSKDAMDRKGMSY